MIRTYKIVIKGQVQGVGFRPFVFNLAQRFKLTGTVSNNEEGVIIMVRGNIDSIHGFYSELIKNPPPVSRISTHSIFEHADQEFPDFRIVASEKNESLNLQLTPDFAICSRCSGEIDETANRRFNYPFTTCVNCGPRWSITSVFPFERHHTSMVHFHMCDTCKMEYTDPMDWRFHSQTNSCPKCGIRLRLVDKKGKLISDEPHSIFASLSELIKKGKIMAIQNTGGYLLCCDATNPNVIDELRKRKRRPNKPFAILYPSMERLDHDFDLLKDEVKALQSPERPIVILRMQNFRGEIASENIAPGLNQMGVMLPYTGILKLFAEACDIPVIATSGNLHGSPIISNQVEATNVLAGVADYFLHHNLDILNPQDDSVLKFSPKTHKPILFRRSRGYAPNYYGELPINNSCVIAMGADLKSAVGIFPNDYLYISQYLGNLENFEVVKRFEVTVNYMVDLFEKIPKTVLVDAHPNYHCSRIGVDIADKLNADLNSIQHHRAHFAAVLGEHSLQDSTEPILGVIWDGTGFGDDGQIWGGEFFEYSNRKMTRINHFEYFNWLAADKMSKEPRLSFLSLAEGEVAESVREKFSDEEIRIYSRLKSVNKLKTSSVGRILDAIASATGICDFNTYEGEAPILMENRIGAYDIADLTAYDIVNSKGRPDGTILLSKVLNDLGSGSEIEQLLLKVHYTLARLVIEFAASSDIRKIACSGGVFQNAILIDMLTELASNEFELFFNFKLAPNDENIPFGQMIYQLEKIKQS